MVAVPIALLNKLVLEAVAEAQQAGQQASRAVSVLSRVAVVAQVGGWAQTRSGLVACV